MIFSNKVAIVTGAASGIGAKTAELFQQGGAKVVVADINENAALSTAKDLGQNALGLHVDVANEQSCEQMVAETIKHFGRVDYLFNNAGLVGKTEQIEHLTSDEWRRVIEVNLSGVFYCTKYVVPAMKNKGGVIINASSIDGLTGMSSFSAYTAAKHGVIGLTKCCALEYGTDNIRCMAICPGYVETEMTRNAFDEETAKALESTIPIGRRAQPVDIANLVIWLCSEQAAYLTGTEVRIDGGIMSGFSL